MASTRTPSKTPRRVSGNTGKQNAQIVWALAAEGDINETHAGGNATKTLQQRLQTRGVKLDSKDVYNRLYSLQNKGWITRVMKDNKCYAIRLHVEPSEVGPNPFDKRSVGRQRKDSTYGDFSLEQAVHGNGNGNGHDHSEMTMRERVDLAMELLASVKADLDRI